ncbi:MAG: enoyl-CoA hydratase-related protein, partial [Candidatus Puniceispirillum sp.]
MHLTKSEYEHWQIEQDADGVVWLGLDVAGKSVNVLTIAVLDELAEITQALADAPPSGLVLHSLKSRGFIFGADINEFESFTSQDDVKAHVLKTLETIQRIEDLPCPTVALIDGVALGGGCELALGFDVIIGVDDPAVQIGFPEVNLGLLPGYGGTGRMFKRAGITTALNMVLYGKPLNAQTALSVNIFDSLVNNNNKLIDEAKKAVKDFERRGKAIPP